MSATELRMLHNLIAVLQTSLQTLTVLSQSSGLNDHLARDVTIAVCSLQHELAITIMTNNPIPNEQSGQLMMTLGNVFQDSPPRSPPTSESSDSRAYGGGFPPEEDEDYYPEVFSLSD